MPKTSAGVHTSTTSRDQRWLDQVAAAEYLGVTDRTIRNYISRGVLPARRIRSSRQIRIDRTDLDRLLEPIPSARAGAE